MRFQRMITHGSVAIILPALGFIGCGKSDAKPTPPPAPAVVVEVSPAYVAPLDEAVFSIGQVVAVDSVALTVKVAGIISVLHVEDGQMVGQGALLAELDNAETQASLREAAAVRDNAALELKRSEPLVSSGIVNANQIDDLRARLAIAEAQVGVAQARFDDRRVFAPFAGRLGLRRVSVGAFAAPGTVITTLTRVTPMKLTFSVPESQLPRLKPGLQVHAHAPAFKDRVFTGEVTAIDSAVDPATHTIAVQALVPNPDEALKPGISLDVELVVERIEGAITIPEAALLLQGDQAAVFAVVDSDGHPTAKRMVVTTGARANARVQIRSGLDGGSMVVVQGVQNLRDGMAVVQRGPESAAKPAGAKSADATPAAPAAGVGK